MNSPATIIRQFLVDAGKVSANPSATWAAFTSFLPDKPDTAVAFFDTPGRMDGRLMRGGVQIIHPGIQIRLRCKRYPDGWAKAATIALFLDAARRDVVGMESDAFYMIHNVSRTSDIMPLGVETDGDRKRHAFVLNAVVTISQVTPLGGGLFSDDGQLFGTEGGLF